MITIPRIGTNHDFEKQNLVTQIDKKGAYDLYKCALCGLTGKSYGFRTIEVSGRNTKTAYHCPKVAKIERIKITKCTAVGKVFGNLTPGSVHDVVDPPQGKNNSGGVWVMGVGEPVKVLFEEYEEIQS